ncbi:MAG: hypothetical protein MUE77_06510 [Sandarakinorhabdus sp.]|nr:hypothetical protein [Sandarakinorhabdus sp.]
MASWIEIANAALVRMGYGTTLTALDEAWSGMPNCAPTHGTLRTAARS